MTYLYFLLSSVFLDIPQPNLGCCTGEEECGWYISPQLFCIKTTRSIYMYRSI